MMTNCSYMPAGLHLQVEFGIFGIVRITRDVGRARHSVRAASAPGSTPAPGCGGTRPAFRGCARHGRERPDDFGARFVFREARPNLGLAKLHPGRVRSPDCPLCGVGVNQ